MILLITALMVSVIFLPLYQKILIRIGSVHHNYQNRAVPFSFGIFIFMIESLFIVIFKLENLFVLWLSFLFITLVGLYDDLFGITTIKGLKGHFTAFFKGEITSGFIKAITGFILALFLSVYYANQWWEAFTAFFLILLMINTVNLFDLRPGRALKLVFFLFFLLSIATSFLKEEALAYILLGILIILFNQDIRAKIMLGDSGANLLGLHLGFWFSQYFTIYMQGVVILLLVILHIYTERHSLSHLIERNRWLRKIDLWGRKEIT